MKEGVMEVRQTSESERGVAGGEPSVQWRVQATGKRRIMTVGCTVCLGFN